MMTPPESPPVSLTQWIEQRSKRWQEDQTQVLLKGSSLQSLTRAMRALLDALDQHDFSNLLVRPTWWDRLTGAHVLNEVRFRVADREITHLMALAQQRADAQAAWMLKWRDVAQEHAAYVQGLAERVRIEQGVLEAGGLEEPEEREARTLALQNAQLVLVSAQMTAQQFKLMQSRHDSVWRRFNDIKHKLIPVWLDQLTALIHGRALKAGHMKAAMKAYAALNDKLKADLRRAEAEDTP